MESKTRCGLFGVLFGACDCYAWYVICALGFVLRDRRGGERFEIVSFQDLTC